jgi:hypothetical protein
MEKETNKIWLMYRTSGIGGDSGVCVGKAGLENRAKVEETDKTMGNYDQIATDTWDRFLTAFS